MANRKTILIVDDHTLFREGLKDIVSRNPASSGTICETVPKPSTNPVNMPASAPGQVFIPG